MFYILFTITGIVITVANYQIVELFTVIARSVLVGSAVIDGKMESASKVKRVKRSYYGLMGGVVLGAVYLLSLLYVIYPVERKHESPVLLDPLYYFNFVLLGIMVVFALYSTYVLVSSKRAYIKTAYV